MNKFFFTLFLAICLVLQSRPVQAQEDPPIYAEVIQSPSACIRPLPNLSEACSYNIPFQGIAILLPGNSLNFYKIDYTDPAEVHHIGWIWRNRVVLIYP